MKKIVISLFIQALFYGMVVGQSSHYWTQQYGTRSMLLSGSVIGGVSDLGAVYYNPARLGFVENPAFILSADVYQWSRLRFEKAFDDDVNFKKSEFDGVPSLAAGSFKVGFLPNHHFAYAILSRQRINIGYNYREQIFGDVFESWPGDEYFEGEVGLNTNTKEDWFGGSWSHAINNKVSLGASGFFTILNQKKGSNIAMRALDSTNNVALYTNNRNFNLTTYNLIWKLAAAFHLGNVDLGITITTPSIRLRGSGSYNYQYYFSGIEGVSQNNNIYANSYQNNLKADTQSPLAIGIGGSWTLKENFKLHGSAEYYSGISRHRVLRAEDHAMQSLPDSIISFNLYDEFNSVINAGIGVEWTASQKVSVYASMSTDFSSAVNGTTSFFSSKSNITNSTLKSDFYHFGGGIVMKFKGADITLGATHTGARQDIPRVISFPEEGEDPDDIFDPDATSRLIWSRWRFVLSFSVPFLKEYAEEKLEKIQEKRNSD